jgi:DNA polymerase-3 subunit delta'
VTDFGPAREADQLDGAPAPEQNVLPIVGHAAARRNLDLALSGPRLPSAILLHGPQGIGKATLAFALARDILTRTGDEDAHRIGEQIASGSHPNLFVLRRQPKDAKGFYTVIRVDEVRELRDRLRRTRGRAGYRVAVIDAIDDCNPNAANALLKTLEEPPDETLFLLVSHRPGQLLPTIKSRCQNIALRPLGDDEVRTVLAAARPDADAATLDHAVSLAEGRPRRGFEALALNEEGVLAALRLWLENPARGPAAAHLAIAEALAGNGAGAEASFARDIITDWMAAEARASAVAGAGARRRLASANELWDKALALFADAESLNLDARQTMVAIFDAIRDHVHKHASLAEPT